MIEKIGMKDINYYLHNSKRYEYGFADSIVDDTIEIINKLYTLIDAK